MRQLVPVTAGNGLRGKTRERVEDPEGLMRDERVDSRYRQVVHASIPPWCCFMPHLELEYASMNTWEWKVSGCAWFG